MLSKFLFIFLFYFCFTFYFKPNINNFKQGFFYNKNILLKFKLGINKIKIYKIVSLSLITPFNYVNNLCYYFYIIDYNSIAFRRFILLYFYKNIFIDFVFYIYDY